MPYRIHKIMNFLLFTRAVRSENGLCFFQQKQSSVFKPTFNLVLLSTSRLLSSFIAKPKEQVLESTTDEVKKENSEDGNKLEIKLRNRNPRNPEYFGWDKPRGCETHYSRKDFYCRLTIQQSNRHIKAFVEHHSGRILASASTTEFCIAKHLYKTTDMNAAFNIGRVLRERCLEAGVTKMIWDPKRKRNKLKFQALKKGFTGGIISLKEAKAKIFPEQVLAAGTYNKKKKPASSKRKTTAEKKHFT